MKQFFKFFFAALLALVVGGGILMMIFFGILGAFSSSMKSLFESDKVVEVSSTKNKNKEILVIDLNQSYNELQYLDIMSIFDKSNKGNLGLIETIATIKAAKEDATIKGIYLKGNGNANGLATSQQLRDALVDFKTSGKFIVTYAESYGQSDYYLASVADSVFLHPMGEVEIKGMASQIMFFKGALDKLEVKPEIFYCGQFKSATEPFRMDKMSDPNRKQLAAIQADVWDVYLNAFAEKTKLSKEALQNIANTYAIRTAQDALNYNVIDGIKYKDELESKLKTMVNADAKLDVPYVSIQEYAKTVKSSNNKDEIAILVAEGNIIDGTANSNEPTIASDDIIKEIRKVRDNDNIKAVVLRINSGGGSALASENIHRELLKLREKKPYVVSMGDYAASGGYYIAANADSIYASPNTITGSIGVFGMMFSTKDLFKNKLGLTYDTEKNAPFADFPTLSRSFTDEEKVIIQSGVDSVYALFKRRVSEGRKLEVNYVDSVGQGRIWTGTQALKLGLVDALGSLDRAVNGVAAIAGLNNYKVVTYPKQDNQLSNILKMVNVTSVKEHITQEIALQNELGAAYSFYKMLFSTPKVKGAQVYMMMPFLMNMN
jgi:protease-4